MTSPTDAEITEGIAETYTNAVLRPLQALQQRIPELNHPRLCPDRFVDWLAAKVGLSSNVPLASRLDTDGLRRLIPRLMSLWRDKVGADAYRTVIRATTAARSIVADWPALAPVDGDPFVLYGVRSHAWTEGQLGEYDDGDPAGGPWLIEIWAEDVGGLDRDAVVDACRLVSEFGDGVNISFVDLAEDWTQPTRWDFVGTYLVEDNVLTLGPGPATATIDGSGWSDGIHDLRVVLRDTGTPGIFRLVLDGDYELAVQSSVAGANVTLTVLSTATLLDLASVPLADDAVFFVRFGRQVRDDGTLSLRAWVDEVELSGSVATPAARGDLVLEASTVTDEFSVEHLIVIPFNPEVRALPDGAAGAHTP